MRAMRGWVMGLLGAALLAGTAAPARAAVDVGGIPVELPCDTTPKLKGGRASFACGKVSFAVEVGTTLVADAVVAKLTKDVPADRQSRKELDLGGRRAVFAVAAVAKGTIAVFVVEDLLADKDLLMVMVAAPADAEAGAQLFQAMVKGTLAATAKQLSSGAAAEGAPGPGPTPPPERAEPPATPAPGGTAAPTPTTSSKKVGRVAFTIDWVNSMPVSFEGKALRFSRDRHGNLALLLASTSRYFTPAGEIHAFEGGGHKVRGLGFTVEKIYRALGYGDSNWFDQLDGDADGNLFVGIDVYGENTVSWNVFAWIERATGKIEAAVPLKTIFALGDGSGWGGGAVLRAAPDGTAWLFTYQGKSKLRIARVRRDGPGKWSYRELTGFDPGGLKPSDLDMGSPDHAGGYVFYVNKAIWRITPEGKLHKLVAIEMPPEDTTRSRLVVLPNGDIWVAFNMVTDVSQHTTRRDDAHVDVHTTVYVAGHSSWLRIRTRDGVAELGVIDSLDIMAALRRTGIEYDKDTRIFKSHELRYDHKSGGIVAYDDREEILFVLVPKN